MDPHTKTDERGKDYTGWGVGVDGCTEQVRACFFPFWFAHDFFSVFYIKVNITWVINVELTIMCHLSSGVKVGVYQKLQTLY
jgi:hypothetical protein